MARLQWCRKHIDEVAEACCLGDRTVSEVKQAADFCEEHRDFAHLPTRPITTLIRVKDPVIRQKAIIKCRERLNGKIGAGRGNTKGLTEKEIKKIIKAVELEVQKENGGETIIKEITDEEAAEILNDPERGVKSTDPPKNKVYSEKEVEEIRRDAPAGLEIGTISRREIGWYFDIMKRIKCEEDIPKHTKRIDMMIENKTLLLVK